VRIVAELERDGIGFESLTEMIETTNAKVKYSPRPWGCFLMTLELTEHN
jgi:hypothetical protein